MITYKQLKEQYNQDYRDIKDFIRNCLYYGIGLQELKETNLIKSLECNDTFIKLVEEVKKEMSKEF